jgi:hypothetical protein
MKSQLFHASTTLASLALLVASGLHVVAQQGPPIRRLPAERRERAIMTRQQDERPLVELPTQEVNPEAARVEVPRECRRTRPEVQTHDVADSFTPPGSPLSLSAGLANFLNGLNLTPKGYDDPRVNAVFADSFRLRSCRVCYATLEVGARYLPDYWVNDTITAGVAPFNAPGVVFAYGGLWNPVGTNTKTFVLSAAAMNNHIMNGPVPSYLDLIAQDDTDFDYATLSVWYY